MFAGFREKIQQGLASPHEICMELINSTDPIFEDMFPSNEQPVDEPLLRPAPPKTPAGDSDGSTLVTNNGHCGSAHKNMVCGDWPKGSCCSPFGICGNTTSHCGYGCQSGACLSEDALKPPALIRFRPSRLPGQFHIIGRSGVPPMIAVLLQNGRVAFADKVENYTEVVLENGRYAYSTEFDPITSSLAPLSYKTNVFCSGGTFLADGRVLSVGGNGPLKWMDPTVDDGFRGIRYLERRFDDDNFDGTPWEEPGHQLSTGRWYPTVQTLSDGRVFVVSGSLNGDDPSVMRNNNPTYELLDKNGFPSGNSVELSILDENQPYYMYPFLHLLNDGTVFIFVSRSAEVFDVDAGVTVKTLPDLPGDYRTYPNTGGSVLLPLRSANGWEPEIIICGGGAFQDIDSPSDPTCGRIRPLSEEPRWELEAMPGGRIMGEGILLPDGTVIWINGCRNGAQGYGIAENPIYNPWIYRPQAPPKKRWAIGGTSEVPRMYHSVALLLLDGTVLVAGSNPVEQPLLVTNPNDPMLAFPTEFRVEIYTPHYFMDGKADRRPRKIVISSRYLEPDGNFDITFHNRRPARKLSIVLYHGGFVTHSVHMGHRMLYLDHQGWKSWRKKQKVSVKMPPTSSVVPPGPYVIYVLVDGIPGEGQFVMVA
ncbi:glyoxal oxidase [Coccidioides immitis RS]|uniref:Glyoxal oxidase n=2 Tax=Coccidioides immitis TaxID=5501 RepID=J3KGT2_COCIM|nr:glyoxal oxidase [Coccidioides immitis RS]EAS34988.3 glyoxal oxidase [Coccidioides immitis RS]KMU84379.1 glyoxal oxidase [Coccidioides immitis H538.4]